MHVLMDCRSILNLNGWRIAKDIVVVAWRELLCGSAKQQFIFCTLGTPGHLFEDAHKGMQVQQKGISEEAHSPLTLTVARGLGFDVLFAAVCTVPSLQTLQDLTRFPITLASWCLSFASILLNPEPSGRNGRIRMLCALIIIAGKENRIARIGVSPYAGYPHPGDPLFIAFAPIVVCPGQRFLCIWCRLL